jgi:plasmid stabilization system protein ParE
MKVVLTEQSLKNLEAELLFLIEERKIPKTKALDLGKQLLKKAKSLSKHPFKGQEESYLIGLGQEHRRLIESDFKIIYFVENETVYVTDFFYTHKNPNKMKG